MKAKKIIFLITSLIITLFIASSCAPRVASNPAGSGKKDKLFELKIYSDKQEYKTTEKINIWSTIEYMGKDSQIKIWHGEPYLIYSITDGKDFKLDGVVQEILKSTVLEKGKVYRIDYVKSGGFSGDDSKADFWKEFFAVKDLYLPAGEYTIRVVTGFSLGDDVVGSKYDDSAEVKIKVVE